MRYNCYINVKKFDFINIMSYYRGPFTLDPDQRYNHLKDRCQSFISLENFNPLFDWHELAHDGFVHVTSDIIRCFNCHLHLRDFKSCDQGLVNEKHRLYSPFCYFANSNFTADECGNKPMWKIACESLGY